MGAAKKGATATADVDQKLLHLVRKYSNVSENAEDVVSNLRSQHREYQRKDLGRLTAQVESALQQVLDASSRKRKAEARAEVRYEQAARENDAIREQIGVGAGLNASLRQHYRQVQLDRENTAGSERNDADNSDETENTSSAVVAVDEGEKDSTVSESQKSGVESKPKVKRRKVKTRSRSSIGSVPGSNAESMEDVAFLSPVPRPTERYSDLGGMNTVIQQIRQLVEYPLIRPELYRHLGVDPPVGVLLRGPPGTGKTHLACAAAGQLGVPFFRVSAPELVSGMSGESEGRIRSLFKTASDMAPAVIFLDELDAIAPKRSEGGSSRGMEKRMVAQLLTCMDMLAPENNRQNASVLVLAATNRADAMDNALRRAGRFDKEIHLPVPDEEARAKIIKTMTKSMRLSGNFDFELLARKTPGFVGADVKSLAKEAAVLAINRIFRDVLKDQNTVGGEQNTVGGEQNDKDDSETEGEATSVAQLSAEQMEPLFVSMEDFLSAIPLVQPSSKREGFATVPDVSWDDIGALQSIREELTISVLEPIRSPEKFKALGLSLPAGVLLYGPPGCGKTLLAKAIAHESGANFISVKGPELLDKYVGESERAVRVVFERARASSPCVVFFDELDSLVPKRGSDGGSGGVSERVVNQLLVELSGIESRSSVFVIAATNRPELIDPAMLRPGRLDKLLYVPLPSPDDRVSILKALAKNIQIAPDVDLDAIGRSSHAQGYSGADCAALLRESGLAVLKEDAVAHAAGRPDSVPLEISSRHFDEAFRTVLPSVSRKDQARYDRIRDRMARARSRDSTAVENDGQVDADVRLVPEGGLESASPPDGGVCK